MWYKEWLAVRPKFIMTALLMTGLVLLVHNGKPNSWTSPLKPDSSYFSTWTTIAIFAIIIMGIIGGADIFASEKEQNTFSFLLAKPVSRAKVFAVKIGLNAAALGSVFVGANLLLLAFDHLPRTVEYQIVTEYIQANGCPAWTFGTSYYVPAVGMNLGGALPVIASGLALGFASLCLTALISLFSSNTLYTVVLSFIAITFIGVALILGSLITTSTNTFVYFHKPSLAFFHLGILATLALGFLVVGARAFKRKEF